MSREFSQTEMQFMMQAGLAGIDAIKEVLDQFGFDILVERDNELVRETLKKMLCTLPDLGEDKSYE